MINVYIRWKLYCGDDIVFDFGNTEDGHAYVTIGRKTPGGTGNMTIPKEKGFIL